MNRISFWQQRGNCPPSSSLLVKVVDGALEKKWKKKVGRQLHENHTFSSKSNHTWRHKKRGIWQIVQSDSSNQGGGGLRYVLGGEAGHGAKTLFYILVLCMLSHFYRNTHHFSKYIFTFIHIQSLSLLVTTSPQWNYGIVFIIINVIGCFVYNSRHLNVVKIHMPFSFAHPSCINGVWKWVDIGTCFIFF